MQMLNYFKINKLKKNSKGIRVLYLMHIDWDWIFQRPQILSLKLSKYFRLKTIYNFTLFKRKNLIKQSFRPSWSSIYIKLPKYYKFKAISWINKFIEKICKIRDNPKKFDIIWFCYPDLISYIPDDYNGIIIYDCMDDHESMIEQEVCKKEVSNNERMLLERADIILTSSNFLYNKIIQSRNMVSKVYLLRNGYLGTIYSDVCDKNLVKNEYNIGYIGTVASWFDFDILLNSINELDNIKYHIIGPCNNNCYFDGNKLNYEGIIEHDKLYDFIIDYDCLIMPFKINDIILAVDPVKLYEYISYGKCIISVYYPEIERFSDFVYFYNTQDEFNQILQEKCLDGFKPKYNKSQQALFLQQNTWDVRANEVVEIINEFL